MESILRVPEEFRSDAPLAVAPVPQSAEDDQLAKGVGAERPLGVTVLAEPGPNEDICRS